MARWPISTWMGMMAAIVISSDRISIGIVVKSIAISLDHVSTDFEGGFNGGFNDGFDLAVLGY
jgi:hypothetical protein